MLQITSGKLYPNGVGRKNKLRGILYSNLILTGLDDTSIGTAAGTLMIDQPLLPGGLYLVLAGDGGHPSKSVIVQTYVPRSKPSRE
ncbi:MAG: hypothetical protein ACYDBH_24660 [Acidobacteriaceae bacterium]